MKILFADPNRDLLESYRKLLLLRGDETETVFDGTQVLESLPGGGFELLILGERIPRISAGRLLRLAREEGVRSILLQDRRGEDHSRQGDTEADARLSFPFLPEELYRKVDALKALREEPEEAFEIGGLRVQPKEMTAGGTKLTLEEIELLRVLSENGCAPNDASGAVIRTLNRKLAAMHPASCIHYAKGKGYVLGVTHE